MCISTTETHSHYLSQLFYFICITASEFIFPHLFFKELNGFLGQAPPLIKHLTKGVMPSNSVQFILDSVMYLCKLSTLHQKYHAPDFSMYFFLYPLTPVVPIYPAISREIPIYLSPFPLPLISFFFMPVLFQEFFFAHFYSIAILFNLSFFCPSLQL